MNVFEIKPKSYEKYESFLKSHHADLHQSSFWAEFQKTLPGKGNAWILAALDKKDENEDWQGTISIIRHRLPFGFCWLSIVRGPVLTSKNRQKTWETLWNGIQPIARKNKAIFIRIEPPENTPISFTEKNGWLKAHAHHHPEWTLKIDLNASEQEILGQMKPKGRYNIKVAQKRGATARTTNGKNDLDAFYKILKQTCARDNFHIHPQSYYEQWLESAHKNDWGTLLVAEHEGKIIAGMLMTWYGDTATYYYGASDYNHRSLMTPHLLQWEAMRLAKQKGCLHYDLLGIAPPDDPHHPWKGVTEFKEKFGGTKIHYPEAKEWVFRPFLYRLILKTKAIKKIFKK